MEENLEQNIFNLILPYICSNNVVNETIKCGKQLTLPVGEKYWTWDQQYNSTKSIRLKEPQKILCVIQILWAIANDLQDVRNDSV